MCPRFGFLIGRWALLDRRTPCRSLEQLVGRSTDAVLPSIRTPLGGSRVRRIPLESRAGSEPNFQPELDETPEPCVSSRHDAAKRTIGTSIGEDVPCPQEVGIVSDEHKVRSIDGVGVKPADVARAEYRLAVVKNVLQVCSEFDRGAFRHPSFLEERHVPIVKTGRIQRVAADVGPGARARAYV